MNVYKTAKMRDKTMRYVCSECGEVFDDEDIINFDGDLFCDGCYDKLPDTDGSPNETIDNEIEKYEPVKYAIKDEKKHWWNRSVEG
jgi:DNA-directed RNA polymerase subunit RPC12/RpoP